MFSDSTKIISYNSLQLPSSTGLSRRLFIPRILGVDDSLYCWYWDSAHQRCGELATTRAIDTESFPENNSESNSSHQQYAESATLRINDDESRQLPNRRFFVFEISLRIRCQNKKGFDSWMRDLCWTDLYREMKKFVSLPYTVNVKFLVVPIFPWTPFLVSKISTYPQ